MHRRSALAAALAALALIACDDAGFGLDDPSGGDFTITVGTGTRPTYIWGSGAAFTIDVYRASNLISPVWVISDPNNRAIGSPVTHGNVPGGALELVDDEKTLTPGVRYRVTITLANGTTQAYQEFTP